MRRLAWMGVALGIAAGPIGAQEADKAPWNEIDGMFRRKDWTAYMALFAPEYKRIGVDGKAMNRERHYEAFIKAVGKAKKVDVVSKGVSGLAFSHRDSLSIPFDRRLRIVTTEETMIVIEHAGIHQWKQGFDGRFSIVRTQDKRFKWVDYGAMKQYWPKWP